MPGSGRPAATLDRLNMATVVTLRHPETAERLRTIGLEVKAGTPQELAAHLDRELNRCSDLARHVKFEVME